jgi:hypothetical protein
MPEGRAQSRRDGPIVACTKCLEQPTPKERSRRARDDRAHTLIPEVFRRKGAPCFLRLVTPIVESVRVPARIRPYPTPALSKRQRVEG